MREVETQLTERNVKVAIVTFEANVGGQVAPVEYRGTVDASGVWSGDFDLAGLAGGPFTGTKASE